MLSNTFVAFVQYIIQYSLSTQRNFKWIKLYFVIFLFYCLGGSIVGYPRLKLEGDQNSGVYNLTIRDASLTDDGEYQCQVGPYGKIKAIRANANLVVICKYFIYFIFSFKFEFNVDTVPM